MDLQCKLLVSKFNNPRSVALVKENIGRMSDGSLPFCAGALKIGLEKAFKLKKQKRQPPGVSLRCTYSSCAWYTDHVSYSSVGSNLYCPHCNDATICSVLAAGTIGPAIIHHARAVERGSCSRVGSVGSYLQQILLKY